MLFFLYGADTFRSRQKLKALKEKFKTEVDTQGLNLVVLDGVKLTMEKFRRALEISSFFARRRMIVVENLGQSKSKKIFAEILGYLESTDFPQSHILVFWEGEIGKTKAKKFSEPLARNPLFARLQKEEYAQEFAPLNLTQLNRWICEEVKNRGSQIESKAVELLTTYVGENLWQLSNEIDKLVAYARAENLASITSAGVDLLVNARLDENIFSLMDALSARDKKQALKLIQDQLAAGMNEFYLLSMLTRQFRILLQAKEILSSNRGYSASDRLVKEVGLHPYVAKKAVAQVRNFELNDLKNIYAELLDIDVKLKTSRLKPELALDLLVTTAL